MPCISLKILLAGLCFVIAAEAQSPLRGVVRDSSGATIEGASVQIRTAGGSLLRETRTDAEGRFEWADARAGLYQLRVNSRGFAARERVVYWSAQPEPIDMVIEPESIHTRLTVNATRGTAEETSASSYIVAVKDFSDIAGRPLPTLGNALEQAPGILVQQSTYAQVSPFLRGLTGYQVLNIVDGIRFNNSTFRSGPNQYLAFIEPTQAQRVEALLGPTGSQYGSDSLGGTIQVLTRDASFADRGERQIHGDFLLGGATADLSGAGSGRLSIASERLFWLIGASGRRHNDLRSGRGHDSRNVFHRFFGMPLDDVRGLIGSRQQDSGFRQYGVQTKFAARPRPDQLWTVYYQRGAQHGVRGYKDLLGGLGRTLSTFEPQTLNWLYGRYEKTGLGFLDSLTGTFSLNSQSDGGMRQNLRFTDPITRDFNRTDAYGYAVQAGMHRGPGMLASFGGEIFDERITASREVRNPVSGIATHPRPLYPDDSRYRSLGIFGQASYHLTQALRASGGLRFTGVQFKTRADGAFGIPSSAQWFHDVTYHANINWQPSGFLGLHAIVSRGFRAPNLNDLGALGLNDLGYEIPSAEAIPAGALLSTDVGEAAVSQGRKLRGLAAESLRNYEFGARFTARRLYARVQLFDAELYDPIVRRTLLFPASSVPSDLAGLPVTPLPQTAAQREQGVIAVATQLDPRAVKAFVNDGRARYYGLESIASFSIHRWSVQGNYSYILGRELNPNRNIRRLPPQMGSAALRYSMPGRRPWVEVSAAAAGRQDRLNGGDRDDERIGASFRRRDIADFFQGSRVAPYLNGSVFVPTGETLAQIQNRVLPIGTERNGVRIVDDNSRVPLYLSTAGWTTLSLRVGIPFGENWQAAAAIENVLDRNYRIHGSGVDSPGVSAYISFSYRF